MKQLTYLLLILILLSGCAAAPAETAAPLIELRDCTLSMTNLSPVKARCGTLAVPEDPSAPDGKQIELSIAVVPAVSRDPAPDPIFLLAGGPGQAATEAFLPLIPAMERLRFKHDLVMVDQRGTGKSNPLDCHVPVEIPEVLGVEQPLEEQLAELTECRDALDINPLLYGTEVAMGDLDRAREVLGYDQINLLGVSYGTRAALAYLRLYPEHVRTMVLDGVVPPGWGLGVSLAEDANRSLDLTFKRCAEDEACSDRFPDLPAAFERLMALLEAEPVEVTVPDPVSAKPARVLLTPQTVGAAVRLMSYSDLSTALLPLAIDSAAQGDYSILASQYISMARSLEESLGTGMYTSVICAEDIPLAPENAAAEMDYFDADLDLLRASCEVWMGDSLVAAEVQPSGFDAGKPVLLISGEADPVTPPENAEEVAALLPDSLHIVAPGLGHNNFYVGCIPELVLDFIDAGSLQGLDTACVQTIEPMPFFLSPSGPQP